ncbi:hypothetical protein EJ02DRAFT_455948 [Clathrospora elynae]|uniref:Uncharacterized protein n=1 Tax=Clathrospora elynae TaxID=706981 RepID=A0A6A5SLM9_9PLEO|nr:hypothetical protein EJ02DRAFT_455948 [Clathrospora elynae]
MEGHCDQQGQYRAQQAPMQRQKQQNGQPRMAKSPTYLPPQQQGAHMPCPFFDPAPAPGFTYSSSTPTSPPSAYSTPYQQAFPAPESHRTLSSNISSNVAMGARGGQRQNEARMPTARPVNVSQQYAPIPPSPSSVTSKASPLLAVEHMPTLSQPAQVPAAQPAQSQLTRQQPSTQPTQNQQRPTTPNVAAPVHNQQTKSPDSPCYHPVAQPTNGQQRQVTSPPNGTAQLPQRQVPSPSPPSKSSYQSAPQNHRYPGNVTPTTPHQNPYQSVQGQKRAATCAAAGLAQAEKRQATAKFNGLSNATPVLHNAYPSPAQAEKRRATAQSNGLSHATPVRHNVYSSPTRPKTAKPNAMTHAGQWKSATGPNTAPDSRLCQKPTLEQLLHAAAHAPNGIPPNMHQEHLQQNASQEQQALREERAAQAIRDQQARQAYQAYLAEKAAHQEQWRIATEQALERERTVARKEELKKDPSANYRHLHELIRLGLFPIGQKPEPYLRKLLANFPEPVFDKTSDLSLAIMYAKEKWDLYLEFKDVVRCAETMKKRKAQEAKHKV